jgi:hypothetical protein
MVVRREDRGADPLLSDALESECRLERGGAAAGDEDVERI